MAERIPPADPAVDDLRRKARRRLVGAIVLALAAAVILPMLLEKEPRPLGEDVAVRIPPIDEAKFVNRLSPSAPVAAGDEAARPPATSAPASPVVTDAPASAPAEPAAKPEAVAKSDPVPAAKPEPAVKPEPPRGEPKAEARVETKPAVRSEPKPAAGEAARAKPGDGFVVQLAAFSDDKGANALASKLKRNGYPAFTEPIQTSRGTLYRVRVGSYATREAAGDARNKLKGDGYAGIVAPAH